MNVTIVTPFRDSGAIVPRLIEQVDALDYPKGKLRVICVEGDSVDDTRDQLRAWAQSSRRVKLVVCDTGKPKYPSIVHPERFAVLATVFNAGLDAVDQEWSDYVLFIPSDTLFAPDVLTRLLAHEVDLVAPMFWYGAFFYDTWGMRYKGWQFTNFTRQWGASNLPVGLLEMDTIGGMILMRVDVLGAGCRYTLTEVDRGLCKAAQAAGFACWLDTGTHIEHPKRGVG